MPDPIRVLVVGGGPDVGKPAAECLERSPDAFAVTSATDADEALDRLAEAPVDCVVSDYDLPGRDGIEFLEAVRADHGDLPFVLFTAEGSEAVASDAISAGATDSLRKETGVDQYEILANRITNAVERRRALTAASETERRLESLARSSNDVLWMFSRDWSELRFVNDAYESIWGRPVSELEAEPTSFLDGIHPDDRPRVREAMATLTDGEPVDLEYRVNADEDYGRWVWVQGQPVADETGRDHAVVGFARDVTERKEREARHEAANRRLRELQRQFELALESTHTYAWRWDLSSDGVERTPSMSAVFDLSEEPTSVFEGYLEYIHPEDRPAAEAAFEAARTDGEAYTIEYRLDLDDEWVWVEERADVVRTDDGRPDHAFGIVTDVTERRRQAAALERERDRLSTLFDNSPEPAIEYEFEDGEPVVRAVNEAFVETFGYDEAAAIGRSINDLVVPPEQAHEAEELDEEVRAGDRLDVEVRRQTADGERDFRIRNITTPAGARSDGFAIYTDITERRDRERRLDRLRDRIQELLYARSRSEAAAVAAEAAHEIIGAPLSGFHLLDEAGEALEPVGMIEAVGEAWEEPPTYHRDAEAGTRSAVVWGVYQSGEALRIDDTEAYEPLDEPALTRSVIISPVGGHGVFILAAPEPNVFDETAQSLTEILVTFARTAFDRIARETALRERERRLEHQNERLEEFASVISHDLRNPLNVLLGSLEFAEQSGDPEAFERSRRAIARMEQLIDDMLALARAGQTVAEVEPVALASVVDACWTTVETGSAQLVNQSSLTLAANESRLQQLFENLVRNAIEHGGDDVTVTVGDLDDGFYFEDDGPGVPADVRDQVFESGFSTVDGGTGFGLSIVKEIATAHGWDIGVAVGVSGGARFEVTGVQEA